MAKMVKAILAKETYLNGRDQGEVANENNAQFSGHVLHDRPAFITETWQHMDQSTAVNTENWQHIDQSTAVITENWQHMDQSAAVMTDTERTLSDA